MKDRKKLIQDQIIRLEVLKCTNKSKELKEWLAELYKKALIINEKEND